MGSWMTIMERSTKGLQPLFATSGDWVQIFSSEETTTTCYVIVEAHMFSSVMFPWQIKREQEWDWVYINCEIRSLTQETCFLLRGLLTTYCNEIHTEARTRIQVFPLPGKCFARVMHSLSLWTNEHLSSKLWVRGMRPNGVGTPAARIGRWLSKTLLRTTPSRKCY